MADDFRPLSKSQIEDGEFILTSVQHQALLDLFAALPSDLVNQLSGYAQTDEVVNLTTNQSIDGVKQFSKMITIPDGTLESQVAKRKDITAALDAARFIGIVGVFGTGVPSDLPEISTTNELDAYYCNDPDEVNGYSSIEADEVYFGGDIAMNFNGGWIKIAGSNGVVTINGISNTIVDLAFSDLVECPELTEADIGKRLEVVSGPALALVDASSGGLDSGAVMLSFDDAIPAGWIDFTNGAALSRTTYSGIFARYGVMFGSGDGSTTFNVPDSSGYFMRIMGLDDIDDPDRASRIDRGDGTTGSAIGTLQADELASHSHSLNNALYGDTGGGTNVVRGSGAGVYTTASTGGSETRPKNINLRLICKI